ncbi:MAG: hypothetical protein AMS21_12825 [Gemmatimonas sp. SG8_38_2]|nr:MAG: hypothetical protein AMS21_12825 [Gemmatimonas sp. SG8_38_2]
MTAIEIRNIVDRARSAHLVKVLGVYVIVSSAVLQAIDLLTSQFGLPTWFFPMALGLLLIGLPIITATALIQSRPEPSDCEDADAPVAASPKPTVTGGPTRGLKRLFTWRLAILGGVLAFVALGSVGATVVFMRTSGQELRDDAVAVMPFHVVGANGDLWREGLVDLLGTALDATGQFHSSDPRAVLNRWHRAAPDPAELPEPSKAAEVAGQLGAGRVILGSLIRTAPNEVRLAADLYSVRWLRKEATAVVEGPDDQMIELVDQLTLDLLRSVWEGDDIPDVRTSAITTASIPALRAYLDGERYFRHAQFDEAQTAFAKAIEQDSTFALAYFRLAQTYGWFMGLGAEEVPTYLAAAERHSAGLPRRDSLLIRGWKLANVDGNLEAIDLFEELVARYTDDLEAWHGLGDAIFHMGSQIGRPITASTAPLERTLEIDPTFAPALIHLIELAYHQGDRVRGREWTDRYLELDTTSMYARSFRLLSPLEFGPAPDSAQAVAALDTVDADLLHWSIMRMRGPGANLPAYEMVTLALADPRVEMPDRAMAFWHLGEAHLRHGHVAVAVDLFEQASVLSDGELDGAVLYTMSDARELGIAVGTASDELVKRLADKVKYPYPPLAVAAAREGRTEEAEEAIAWLEGWADSAAANGNISRARSLRGRATALRGRIAAVHDSVDTAIDHLQSGLSMINANWNRQRDIERYWLAYLIEDRGREEEAMRIYGSLYWTPWAEPLGLFHRAELHEQRGEFEQAGDYYAAFVQLWEDADPHLQPRVESARLALQRIRGERIAS